ncbi:XRE family transcriptional regulator [Plantactinospora sp. WMMC1484]|uniref:XRE family transcriptional regulator n=1 Tax=Plantactinospora sp. WMMC1484 TaxID=3404122 RepID=UPI003BF47412
MLRAEVDSAALGQRIGVDIKTIDRWIGGRVPHRRNRLAVAAALGEEEAALWPTARPDQAPGFASTGEVVSAYAHRAEVPTDLWIGLLTGAREQIDILAYAAPFVFELMPRVHDMIAEKCAAGARARIALADPDCDHVKERDELEQLGGTLPGRIRNAFTMLGRTADLDGVQVGTHTVHLYNCWYRFDNQAIATPHLFRYRGYQQPALHLRRLSAFGIFETFAEQFLQIWDTVQMREASR